MTKPHTTLSEAVRALELPEPSYWMTGGSTDAGIDLQSSFERASKVCDVNNKAEQHLQATHPEYYDPDWEPANPEPMFTEPQIRALIATIAALVEQREAQEPVAWGNLKVETGNVVPHKTREQAQESVNRSYVACTQEGPYEVVPLYLRAQPTLAATRAADAKLREAAQLVLDEYDRCRADNPPAAIFEILRAAMSPTTTRSE